MLAGKVRTTRHRGPCEWQNPAGILKRNLVGLMLHMSMGEGTSRNVPAELIRERLAHYVGPFTARTAIQTFAKEALGVHPNAVTLEQAPQLLDALGPVLRTLLGKTADEVLDQLREELQH